MPKLEEEFFTFQPFRMTLEEIFISEMGQQVTTENII